MPAAAPVTVTLGSTSYVLTPSLGAKKALNRYAGGYSALFRLLSGFDHDAIAFVIAAGANLRGKAAAAVEDAVYEAGGEAALAPVVRFASICFAGGRDPDVAEKGTAEADALTSHESTSA